MVNQQKKNPLLDPWTISDNFRINSSAFQKVLVKNSQSDETEELFVEFLSEDTFSVHKAEQLDGTRETILKNVKVGKCPEDDK